MKKTYNQSTKNNVKAEILSPPKDGDFDHVARLASEVLNTPFVMILLNDFDRRDGRQLNPKNNGQGLETKLAKDNITISMSCRAYLAEGIPEKDPEAIKKILWENDDLKFCATATLSSSSGEQLGTLYAFDRTGKLWGNVHWEILDVIAKTVVGQLEVQLTANRLLNATGIPVDGNPMPRNNEQNVSQPKLESYRLAPRPVLTKHKTRKTVGNQAHYREARWGY